MANEKIVKLQGGKTALSSPSFIIEQEGRFYVTVAVVEYDPATATTQEQKDGVEKVGKLFKQAKTEGTVTAAPIEEGTMSVAMNTGPKPTV